MGGVNLGDKWFGLYPLFTINMAFISKGLLCIKTVVPYKTKNYEKKYHIMSRT